MANVHPEDALLDKLHILKGAVEDLMESIEVGPDVMGEDFTSYAAVELKILMEEVSNDLSDLYGPLP